MKNNKIITHVELAVSPDLIQTVLSEAEKIKNLILLEEGCEVFVLTTKKEVPNVIVIFAVYTSEEIYKWHLEQDYVKNFFDSLTDKLQTAPKVDYLVGY